MKSIKKIALGASLVAALFLTSCGSSTSTVDGTETGTTDSGVDVANLSTTFETVVSSLIPDISASASSSVSSSFAITYETDTDWANFISEDYSYFITDIFGDPDEAPQVVTKIRVLVNESASTLSQLLTQDADLTCAIGSALNEEDVLDIAFYGEISNGTSEDRYFDCLLADDETTIIYGQDADGVFRFVEMSEITMENTESTEARGDTVSLRQVLYLTYTESTTGEEDALTTLGMLDLQYAQATVYNGVDDTFDSADDVTFKSRSRISGQATFDSEGAVVSGLGDFTVTKYDLSAGFDVTTQVIGRGGYGDGEVSLFTIVTDAVELAASSGTFCIEHSTTAFPAVVESTECAALETAYAWTEDFGFTLTPEIPLDYEAKDFFEADATDLISSTGDNFTIPTYVTE